MLNQVAGGAMALGLAKTYGAKAFGPAALNIFFADHIAHLKSSEVELVQQTGLVLDGATSGFGIGYVASTAVISAGQLMLGNTLDAAVTLGTAAAFSNPAAATCAAIGALYYGYHALDDEQRAALLEKLADGLAIGKELIKSLIAYVENALTKVMNSDLMKVLRSYVSEYASMFGKSLADITRSVSDRVVLVAHQASVAAYDAATSVGNAVYEGAATTGEFGSSVSSSLATASQKSGEWLSDTSTQAKERIVSLFYRKNEEGKS